MMNAKFIIFLTLYRVAQVLRLNRKRFCDPNSEDFFRIDHRLARIEVISLLAGLTAAIISAFYGAGSYSFDGCGSSIDGNKSVIF
jgi:hypothetical protein